jgi:hypothetical protein
MIKQAERRTVERRLHSGEHDREQYRQRPPLAVGLGNKRSGSCGRALSRRGRTRGDGPSENGRICCKAVSGCSASHRTQAPPDKYSYPMVLSGVGLSVLPQFRPGSKGAGRVPVLASHSASMTQVVRESSETFASSTSYVLAGRRGASWDLCRVALSRIIITKDKGASPPETRLS